MNPKTQLQRRRTRLPFAFKWFAPFLCIWILLACQLTHGQNTNAKEYDIKIAYIYKIAHYVHVGNNKGLTNTNTLHIGILGEDPFGPILAKMEKTRHVHNKKIVFKRFSKWADYEPCNILFISKTADSDSVGKALRSIRGTSVLLVGEQNGFEQAGGVLNMYLDPAGKVGIKLNIDAANRDNFRIDARLLQICDVVRDPVDNE